MAKVYTSDYVINDFINDKGLSIKEVAKMFKLKESEVELWQKGAKYPDWKNRFRILKDIQCPVTVEDRDTFKFVGRQRSEFDFDNKMEYYRSDVWRDISERRMKLDGHKCKMCGSKVDLVVHHTTYERWGGNENIELDLMTLCQSCHAKIHGKKTEKISKELDSGRKILVLPKVNGDVKVIFFTAKISDSDINKYKKYLEKKYGVEYKYSTIVELKESSVIDSVKLKQLLKG